MRVLRFAQSLRGKVFIAFLLMSAATGGLGWYCVQQLDRAGEIVVDTYDRPMMAINFARSASLTFARLDKRATTNPGTGFVDSDPMVQLFFDDLEVARERSLSERSTRTIDEIEQMVRAWRETTKAGGGVGADEIVAKFERLVDQVAQDGFKERQLAVTGAKQARTAAFTATGAALGLSALITLALGVLILRPLATAARVAGRISEGWLETPIPEGGHDETGVLLQSMRVMQDNIRQMLERERAQRRSAQQRLIDALESSNDGILLVDADGDILIANSHARRQLGTPSRPIQGAVFIDAFFPEYFELEAPEEGEVVANLADGAADGVVRELQLLSGIWIRVSLTHTLDGSSFVIWTDITDLKLREEQYRLARLEAESASAAKTGFLATMSHELRTPLHAMIGFADLFVQEAYGPLGNAHYDEFAREMESGGRRLLGAVDKIIDMADCESGQMPMTIEPLDLQEIVNLCARRARADCEAAGLEFCLLPAERQTPVLADLKRLAQAVQQLLDNAVKFTPEGQVTLRCATSADGTPRIEVVDTGVGIADEDLAVAMLPFGQVAGFLARSNEGLGLGLPLAKALLEAQGWQMDIQSRVGAGTRVVLSPARSVYSVEVIEPLNQFAEEARA